MTGFSARDRIVPLVVAFPMFLQNLDTSIMATALPTIARALQVEPLHLNLAITAYLLSLAVFLPLSGWCAERFGPKRVFCAAIAFFSLGSALCGLAQSLPQLVACRIVQGLGGALMIPVGRLILLRSVPPSRLVAAMVWYTVPPAIGRMVGPLVGGLIVSYVSWRWIFLINVPFGVLGIALAWWFVRDDAPEGQPPPFDVRGFLLLAVGLTSTLAAMEVVGKALVPGWVSLVVGGFGLLALAGYGVYGGRVPRPILDLGVVRHRTYFTSLVGGAPLRIAVGASPFLLPLMLQLGFGMTPLESGMLTVATAVGALATRVIMRQVIRRAGFRTLLLGTTVCTSLSYAAYSLFTPQTPHWLIFITLMLGGLINSMGLVSLQTLGFSAIPKPGMPHATTLMSMAQQVTQSVGVTLGAGLVALAAWWRGGDSHHLQAHDFSPAYVVIGLMTMVSLVFFLRLRPDEGAELRE